MRPDPDICRDPDLLAAEVRRLRTVLAADAERDDRPLGDPEIAVEILKLRVAELEQAIRRLAEQDATLSVCDGNVTVTMDGTLTDAEREAVEVASVWVNPERHATLRGLLERFA